MCSALPSCVAFCCWVPTHPLPVFLCVCASTHPRFVALPALTHPPAHLPRQLIQGILDQMGSPHPYNACIAGGRGLAALAWPGQLQGTADSDSRGVSGSIRSDSRRLQGALSLLPSNNTCCDKQRHSTAQHIKKLCRPAKPTAHTTTRISHPPRLIHAPMCVTTSASPHHLTPPQKRPVRQHWRQCPHCHHRCRWLVFAATVSQMAGLLATAAQWPTER